MQALAQAHMRNHQLSTKQFLRSSYHWRFSKDITDLSLCNDTKRLEEQGIVPPYAVTYLIHIYGVQ